jgi:cell division protein FtsZ
MSLGGGALMAIGRGKGEDKALSAVHEALEHPLLESVSLESSAGIIANFTAGTDLSLIEVSNALQYLQERANPNTEIVMGAIQNTHLEDETQVILIVTGLGATPIDSVLQGADKVKRQKEIGRRAVSHSLFDDRGIKAKSTQNLDLPAFLRR